ncbi:MAG: glycosyl transferase family 9 [Nitrosomonadales bacterium]|nr:MAG: glycosyl transferase family 9 [Nitrosomonadales bacterium]
MDSLTSKLRLKIIVIRRDNIGDLVCTTPIFHALRLRYPDAHICALVNSYNVDVLRNNPDINEIYAYTKAKHREKGETVLGVYISRLRLFAKIRRQHFDYAIIAGAHFIPRALRLARMIRPRHILGFTESDQSGSRYIDIGIPYTQPHPMHEVEDIFRLLAPLGIEGKPPETRVIPESTELVEAQKKLRHNGLTTSDGVIGVHISARKISQRWPATRFAELIQKLHELHGRQFILFWSPGDENNPLHPGDDSKAKEIMDAVQNVPILAYPTHQLRALIGGLSLCDIVICSDGGAMHLAAGLGKPILCFFGKSDAARWHPWGVPHRVLQPASREVNDISVEDAMTSFASLLNDISSQAPEC